MGNLLNILNYNNILNRSFNDQGGAKKHCSASFINELEQVVITNEDVDNKLCCAICQDNFKMGEKVLKLPWQDPHYYHFESDAEICEGILPWLKVNNSCPICREEFPEEQNNQENSTPDIEEGDEGNVGDTGHGPIQDINDMMAIIRHRYKMQSTWFNTRRYVQWFTNFTTVTLMPFVSLASMP